MCRNVLCNFNLRTLIHLLTFSLTRSLASSNVHQTACTLHTVECISISCWLQFSVCAVNQKQVSVIYEMENEVHSMHCHAKSQSEQARFNFITTAHISNAEALIRLRSQELACMSFMI